MRKIFIVILRIIQIPLFIISCSSILIGLYFVIHGSLEMFPTDEQDGKMRIMGVLFILLALIIFLLAMLIRKLIRWIEREQ